MLYNLRSSEEKKISIPRFFVHKEVDPNPNFRFFYTGLLCQGNKYKSRSFAYRNIVEIIAFNSRGIKDEGRK